MDRSRAHRTAPLALACALAVAGCKGLALTEVAEAGAARPKDPSPDWLVQHGEYGRAVEVARARAEARPGDARAEEVVRLTSVALLLEQGRRFSFDGRDEEALERLRAAEQIGPDVEQVGPWIRHVGEKLAIRRHQEAVEWLAQDNFPKAIESFEQALSYWKDYAPSREYLARTLVQYNYRLGMGEEYYREGVQALNEFFLEQAWHDFRTTIKYVPQNERAEQRADETSTLRASQRARIAAELEEQGMWAGARNEYRLALLLDPEEPDARDGFARAEIEAHALERMRAARKLVLQEEFDDARAKLAEGAALTVHQREAFEAAAAEIEEAQLESLYYHALTYEGDQQYDKAAEAYASLLARTPFYKDALTRKDTMESYVREAESLYEKAAAAQTDEEQLALLRRIAVFWVDFRDVRARIAELEKRAGAP